MTTARATRRTLAVIAAMTVVVAQLLAIWHHAAVRHHWCAEHQDVCEDERVARTDRTDVDQPHAVITTAPRSQSGSEHSDGCALSGVSLTSTLKTAPRPEAIPDLQALRVESREPAVPVVSRGLLDLAPKTSPPLA